MVHPPSLNYRSLWIQISKSSNWRSTLAQDGGLPRRERGGGGGKGDAAGGRFEEGRRASDDVAI